MATYNINNNIDAATEERRHPTEPENLPCPRCDSTNTKFCYYNNYNLSQPRYFCKSCRRYWTRGGTLRNIPVGGGTRKNSKRSRSSCSSSSSVAIGSTVTPLVAPPMSTTAMFEIHKVGKTSDEAISKWQDDLELNMNEGSFTSLLTTNANANANASGYGLGYGIGPASYDDLGFGLGASMSVGNETHDQQLVGVVQNGGDNTWQFGGGEGVDGAGCFRWPDLAI